MTDNLYEKKDFKLIKILNYEFDIFLFNDEHFSAFLKPVFVPLWYIQL